MIRSTPNQMAFLLLGLLSFTAQAQDCIDTNPVGDGWGWNGTDSCRVPDGTQTTDTTDATCIDTNPVGDGWGWNGTDSCRVPDGTQTTDTTDATCIDTNPVGDGWGWNGTDSCRVPDGTQTTDTADSAICIDTNPVGDGWGWNGTDSCRVTDGTQTTDTTDAATCIDTDPVGDGWGWNGTDSCRVPDGTLPTDTTATATCIDTNPVGDGWGWNGTDSCEVGGSTISTSTYEAYPFGSITALPRVQFDWTPALRSTWSGVKSRNIDSYNTSMVHRPKSEVPGDAVSEGIGYGLIMALYSNDQTYFNRIWDAGEQYLWNGELYDWRSDEFGTVIATGAATDAEQDIAMMLIFADDLVSKGIWQGHTSPQGVTYADRAQQLLNLIWNTMVDGGLYLRPGNFWGGRNLLNPGYFSPAWYRLYKQFDSNQNHNWDALIDQSYKTIEASSGYNRGLVPDWSDAWGNTLSNGPGYNAYDNGHSMFKDGIRTFWRIATDALWFNEPRATAYLNNATGFIKQAASNDGSSNNANSPAHMANFYQLNGQQVPASDIWTELNGGNTQRSRNEHSHLTISMWATAAMGTRDTGASEAFSRELQTFYEGGDYWGLLNDPSGLNEDLEHNEMYFDQILAWFGAAMLNGNFCNILTCVR